MPVSHLPRISLHCAYSISCCCFAPCYGHLEFSEMLSSGSCWKGLERWGCSHSGEVPLDHQGVAASFTSLTRWFCSYVGIPSFPRWFCSYVGIPSFPLLGAKAIPPPFLGVPHPSQTFYTHPEQLELWGQDGLPSPWVMDPCGMRDSDVPSLLKSELQSWSDFNPASCFLSPFRQER